MDRQKTQIKKIVKTVDNGPEKRFRKSTFQLSPDVAKKIKIVQLRCIYGKSIKQIRNYFKFNGSRPCRQSIKTWYLEGLRALKNKIPTNKIAGMSIETIRNVDIYKFKHDNDLTWAWINEYFRCKTTNPAVKTLRKYHKMGLKYCKIEKEPLDKFIQKELDKCARQTVDELKNVVFDKMNSSLNNLM